MEYAIAIAYIAGGTVGLIVFYYIIMLAVRDGIVAADKLKSKQEPTKKA